MTYQEWYKLLLNEAKKELAKSPKVSPIHKMDHISRVWRTSEKLGKKLGADMEALAAAVSLHDLARHYGLEIHGVESAKMAKPILAKVRFPITKTEIALDAISKHDYTTSPEDRKSIESKILYDADKLDAFGYIGILRYIQFYYSNGMPIDEILKMMKKRWNGVYMKESKQLGKPNFDLTYNFFVKLKEELNEI